MSVSYSDNQKTVDYEDDIKSKRIWCCYKANTWTSELLNHLLHEMGLFTLHNECASSFFEYLKSWIESKSQLPIPEFSGYHCINYRQTVMCTAIEKGSETEWDFLFQRFMNSNNANEKNTMIR